MSKRLQWTTAQLRALATVAQESGAIVKLDENGSVTIFPQIMNQPKIYKPPHPDPNFGMTAQEVLAERLRALSATSQKKSKKCRRQP